MREKIKIFTDGGSRGNPGPAGIGVYITDAADKEIFSLGQFLGTKTNNEAEYLAFLRALQFLSNYCQQAYARGRELELEFYADSKLLIEQLNKRWKIKEPRLLDLAQQAWRLLATLPYPSHLQHVLRADNKQADLLVNQALDQATLA